MMGHAEKCLERCCELVKSNVSHLKQVETLCMDVHQMVSELLSQKENSRQFVCNYF